MPCALLSGCCCCYCYYVLLQDKYSMHTTALIVSKRDDDAKDVSRFGDSVVLWPIYYRLWLMGWLCQSFCEMRPPRGSRLFSCFDLLVRINDSCRSHVRSLDGTENVTSIFLKRSKIKKIKFIKIKSRRIFRWLRPALHPRLLGFFESIHSGALLQGPDLGVVPTKHRKQLVE